jgi:branched-chain amino acid transport system permease protein
MHAAPPPLEPPPAWPAGWLGHALALLCAAPLLLTADSHKYYIELLSKVMIMAIFALSLQLLIGYTGLVSLGHAAYFAMAAYATAMLAPQSGPGNGWLLLLGAVGAAAALALVVGAPCCARAASTSSWSRWPSRRWCISCSTTPRSRAAATAPISTSGPSSGCFRRAGDRQRACAVLLAGAGGAGADGGRAALLLRSRFGHALVGIRHNEQRMRAAGYATYRYQLGRLRGGRHAGGAGRLSLCHPVRFRESGDRLVAPVGQRDADGDPGRRRQLAGAVLGAFSFVLLAEWFGTLTKHWQLLMGGFIIAAVALLPRGLVSVPAVLRHRRRVAAAAGAAAESHTQPGGRMNTIPSVPVLDAQCLTRRFGGLTAVNQVDLSLHLHEIHAVIGTNGAGKSTLINLLSGELPPAEGRRLQGRMSPAGRSRSWRATAWAAATSATTSSCR